MAEIKPEPEKRKVEAWMREAVRELRGYPKDVTGISPEALAYYEARETADAQIIAVHAPSEREAWERGRDAAARVKCALCMVGNVPTSDKYGENWTHTYKDGNRGPCNASDIRALVYPGEAQVKLSNVGTLDLEKVRRQIGETAQPAAEAKK
jgi:hypothetical protein